MELRDDQPTQHEFGSRTYLIAPVEPLDVDGVRTVQVGTVLFLIAFVGLLPFYGRLEETGRTWLLWMCLTGVGLGLLGTEYCKRRRQARAERDTTAHDAHG
ncbi:DUF2530 domain-containing protein [Nocardioides sp. BYT-33-1]|uniref:DUF2530 domain-containing protein n=1 Tax=Nocardioides sp. BYT-33-1 TaxID=3416952 RepID=UPI003F53BDCD